ncbi:hypothetical protein Tco_0708201 [Tanacetum coccineum]
MDDTSITMEEYIRIEEEKAQRRGLIFDWQTAKFGRTEHDYKEECFLNFEEEFPAIVFRKINSDSFDSEQREVISEYDDDEEDFETKFPAIVFNASNSTPPCEPTVSPPNESELDFRISCDESDDEDYTVIFDENSFSYKLVAVNDLKTISENDDNDVASSHDPKFDFDLDCFNDFENEFPAIVYNDGLTSKSDLINRTPVKTVETDDIEPIDETSLSEYEEEVISRFNDLFNDAHSVDSKSENNNDDNNIGTEQFSGDMAPLPAADQRHLWLRYQVPGYTPTIVQSYEQRLTTIWSRPVNRVHVLDFAGLTPEMRQDLAVRAPLVWEFILEFLSTCRMSDTVMDLDTANTLFFQLGGVRRSMSWRQFILALGLHTEQEMAEGGFGAYWAGSDRLIPDKGDLSRGQAPEKVTGVDLFYLRSMDRGTVNVPHLLSQYLFRFAEGRKSGARLSGGHFIGRLATHFGLVSNEGLRGLQVVTREFPLIDLNELGRLHICSRYGDTWAWVAPGPERQQAAAAGAPEADEGDEVAAEDAQEIPTPTPAPA